MIDPPQGAEDLARELVSERGLTAELKRQIANLEKEMSRLRGEGMFASILVEHDGHKVELLRAKDEGLKKFLKSYAALGQLVNPIITLVSVAIAFIAFYYTNAETRKQGERVEAALRQTNTAKAYDMGISVSKMGVDHPEILEVINDIPDFFDRQDLRHPLTAPPRTAAERAADWAKQDKEARDKMGKLLAKDPQSARRVYSYVEHLADFMDYAYVQRKYFSDEDWETWWCYFCTEYDHNPYLRQLARVRGSQGWYILFREMEKSDDDRKAQYEKIRNDRLNERGAR